MKPNCLQRALRSKNTGPIFYDSDHVQRFNREPLEISMYGEEYFLSAFKDSLTEKDKEKLHEYFKNKPKVEKPKILIIGHGRHGKDAAAEIFKSNWGYSFESSSMAAARIFLYEKLKDEFGYESFEECYEDRHNHRVRWFNEITAFNATDKSRLAKEIMKHNDMYVGMRSWKEIEKCKEDRVFDYILWIERPGFPEETADSFDITKADAEGMILNDGTLEDLSRKIDSLVRGYHAFQDLSRDVIPLKR